MKGLLISGFLVVARICFSQSGFIQEARYHLPRTDSLFSFHTGFNPAGTYDYFADSTGNVELLLNELLVKGNRNQADQLKQSLVLTQLATLCVKRIHAIVPEGSKRKESLEKRIRRIFFGSSCSFGLIEVISFEIPLVRKSARNFHYNRNGPDGGFNLYAGKSKPKPTKHDPEPEEKALERYTYEEIRQLVKTQFNRKQVNRHLAEKTVSAFGYYLQLDQSTVNCNRIPKLKVLIILGEKRFSYRDRRKFGQAVESSKLPQMKNPGA